MNGFYGLIRKEQYSFMYFSRQVSRI
uniref:Uncharacterized protein n=1 Tax=Rhizophora mucronata TaxID=61149 RepID=A0A2P2PII9_RHIMU